MMTTAYDCVAAVVAAIFSAIMATMAAPTIRECLTTPTESLTAI